MKRLNLFTTLFAVAVFTVACTTQAESNTNTQINSIETVAEVTAVTAIKTSIKWKGFKIIGGGHEGTLAVKENKLTFNDGTLTGGEISIDMTSLKATDLEGEYKQKLEAHLISPDFFSVKKYPTSKFVITSVKPGSASNTLAVTGKLSIRSTTLEEVIIVEVKKAKGATTYSTTLKIDRTKYGVEYGSTNFFDGLGDKAIANEFELNIEIVVPK